MLRRLFRPSMDPKDQTRAGFVFAATVSPSELPRDDGTPSWAPLEAPVDATLLPELVPSEAEPVAADREGDSPSARTMEVLAARDPADARFESAADPRIPSGQLYFKIGEVSRVTGIKPYVLRYWEDEFPWIRPEKTSSRQRRYRRQDIALVLRIARLRYVEGLTIDGTRQVIRDEKREDASRRGRAPSRSPRKRAVEAPPEARAEGGAPDRAASGGGLGSDARARTEARVAPGEGLQRKAEQGSDDRVLGLLPSLRPEVFAQATTIRGPQVARALAELRKTVLELLEAVEE